MNKMEYLKSGRRRSEPPRLSVVRMPTPATGKALEVVLKCDSFGSVEAVRPLLEKIEGVGVSVKVIHADVGDVSKSDILLASTGSRMVLGFNVGTMPKLDSVAKESGVDVRLFNVIYDLIDDVKRVVLSWQAREESEKVLGRARVIALFKAGHGVILGCELEEGVVAVGQSFRVVSAMGPVYVGKIESLQVEHKAVKQVGKGTQVGIKIAGFKDGKLGDLIETYEKERLIGAPPWKPKGEIIRKKSAAA